MISTDQSRLKPRCRSPERKRGVVDDHQALARQTANSLVNFFGAAAFCSFT